MKILITLSRNLVILNLAFFVLLYSVLVLLVSLSIGISIILLLLMLCAFKIMKRWSKLGSSQTSEGSFLGLSALADPSKLFVPFGLPLCNPIRNFIWTQDSYNGNFLKDSGVFFLGLPGQVDSLPTESYRVQEELLESTEAEASNMVTSDPDFPGDSKSSTENIDVWKVLEDSSEAKFDISKSQPNSIASVDPIFVPSYQGNEGNNAIQENKLFYDSDLESEDDFGINDLFDILKTDHCPTDFETLLNLSPKGDYSNLFNEKKINSSNNMKCYDSEDWHLSDQYFGLSELGKIKTPHFKDNYVGLFRSKTDNPQCLNSINSRENLGFSTCVRSFSSKNSGENPEKVSQNVDNKDHPKISSTEVNKKSQKLDLTYEEYAKSDPDTVHFMRSEESSFVRPIESEISSHKQQHKDTTKEPRLPHTIWDQESLESVKITHFKPENLSDLLAFISVKILRAIFDLFSGYSLGMVDERGWINRIVFLETIAGVPGMVGAMIRHLNSLRRMEKDYGWIHVLLEEAENERMHLMTAIVLKKPSKLFRFGIISTQAFFLTVFSVSYLLFPQFSHRIVGYFEEEAVRTYSKLINEIDAGNLPLFTHQPAPPVAIQYWELSSDAKLRDVFQAIRADESHHREVNHLFASISQKAKSPF